MQLLPLDITGGASLAHHTGTGTGTGTETGTGTGTGGTTGGRSGGTVLLVIYLRLSTPDEPTTSAQSEAATISV